MNSTNKEIEKTVHETIEKPKMKKLKESKNQEIDKSQIKNWKTTNEKFE